MSIKDRLKNGNKRLTNLFLRTGLVASTAIGALGIGCDTTMMYTQPSPMFQPRLQMQVPQFFTCNEWIDSNQDGCVELHELKGIKNHFRAHERVTIGYISFNKKGAKDTLKIWNPQNTESGEISNIIAYQNNVRRYVFEPWEIYNTSGAGEYTYQWELNNNPVYRGTFMIIP